MKLAIAVLEQVMCDVCGAEGASPVFRRPDDMQVVECEQCGLMYVNPRPATGAIESWYCSDYFSGEAAKAGRGYSGYFNEDGRKDLLIAARRKVALVSRHFGFQGARVLEIGCATGEACSAVAEKGAQVVGCDISSDAIRVARRRYPTLQFQTGPIERLPFATASFDAVLAFELIEHVASPSVFIGEVYRVLRPGGLLALTTPNVECGRRMGWHQWTGFLTSFEHLYFFNSQSLERMLSRSGIAVVAVYSQGEGRISEFRTERLKTVLRRLRLFSIAKALYRSAFGPRIESWIPSGVLHTLMMVARKT